MRQSFVRLAALAAAIAIMAMPSLISAQTTGTVRGRVTDAVSGRALSDAQVVIDGTRLGGVSNANGDYTISSVPAGPRSVTIRRIGYQPVTRTVNVGVGASARGRRLDTRLRWSSERWWHG